MFKKLAIRGLFGFTCSVLIGQLVSILISLGTGSGEFYPVTEEFRALFSSEISAVITQLILIGLIGTTFSISSVLFEIEEWSFLKQGLIHFIITSIVWIPVVYLCWMPKGYSGLVILLINLLGTYIITWLIHYLLNRRNIKKINEKINEFNNRK